MTGNGASDLIRAVGLLADGPVLWRRPVRSTRPGVFLVELPAPLASAPLDLALVGKWLERATELRLDGERPTSKTLLVRLSRDWIPGETVVFVGSTSGSLAARVSTLQETPAGDRRPDGAGLRLHVLRGVETCRVWWAETDAPEEYEDALLDAFAAGVDRTAAASLDGFVAPFAVVRRPTGEERPTGIAGEFVPEAAGAPSPPSRYVDVPPADDQGRQVGAPTPKAVAAPGTTPRAGSLPGRPPAPRRAATGRTSRAADPAAASAPSGGQDTGAGAATVPPPDDAPEGVHLSREGHSRLEAELRELRTRRRPEAVRRVAAARELGDLRENSEYHAAREELGFIDGRIQAIEARLRSAIVVEGEDVSGRAMIGSTLVVESEGVEHVLRLVGSSEADLAAGRISVVSPVGRALAGRSPGDEVTVQTPAGQVVYRVLRVD